MLVVATLLSGCSNQEDLAAPSAIKTWTATVSVTKGDVMGVEQDTRAVFIGGNTNRYVTLWDQNDVVQVYKSDELVGTLSLNDAANKKYWGSMKAELSGTLTGDFAEGDELKLYLPSKARSYTGQKGTITDLSLNFSYQTTTVQVASVTGSTIALSEANMNQRQAYLWFILKDEDGNRLHPSQLTISAAGDKRIVTELDAEGNPTAYGDIVVNTEAFQGEYPGDIYVAILHEDYDEAAQTHASVTYHLTAVVDGVAYVGKTDWTPATVPDIGGMRRGIRTMVKSTLESSRENYAVGGSETWSDN